MPKTSDFNNGFLFKQIYKKDNRNQ